MAGVILDPYRGGFDQKGWPFKGTLYQQDISRMLADIPEIRHLSDVELYDVSDKENHNVASLGYGFRCLWDGGARGKRIVAPIRDKIACL